MSEIVQKNVASINERYYEAPAMSLVVWRARPCFWFFTTHTRIGARPHNTSPCCWVEWLPTYSNTNFTKIRRLGTVMTRRPTDMTKLIGTFRYSCEHAYKPLSLPSTSFHIRLSWSSLNSMSCNMSIWRLYLTFEFDIQRTVHCDIFL